MTMKPKRTRPTPEKADKLLEALAAGATITDACAAEGIGRSTYYEWREACPAFAERADSALDAGTDTLEEVARKRAVDGSDTLLIFLLKGRRPEKFRERYTVEGGDKPIEIQVTRRIVEAGNG